MDTEAGVRLKKLLEIIPGKLRQISHEEFTLIPQPGKWSKQQIVGHLVDSALNNHQRFIRIQYEETPTIVYDPNKWNELNHYQLSDTGHIIDLWQLLNQHILGVISCIPAEALSRKGNSGLPEPVTLAFYIDDYIDHMEHHLKQIVNY